MSTSTLYAYTYSSSEIPSKTRYKYDNYLALEELSLSSCIIEFIKSFRSVCMCACYVRVRMCIFSHSCILYYCHYHHFTIPQQPDYDKSHARHSHFTTENITFITQKNTPSYQTRLLKKDVLLVPSSTENCLTLRYADTELIQLSTMATRISNKT